MHNKRQWRRSSEVCVAVSCGVMVGYLRFGGHFTLKMEVAWTSEMVSCHSAARHRNTEHFT
jgi:hypothetical protein